MTPTQPGEDQKMFVMETEVIGPKPKVTNGFCYAKVYTVVITEEGKSGVLWYGRYMGKRFNVVMVYREGYNPGRNVVFKIVELREDGSIGLPVSPRFIKPMHCKVVDEVIKFYKGRSILA